MLAIHVPIGLQRGRSVARLHLRLVDFHLSLFHVRLPRRSLDLHAEADETIEEPENYDQPVSLTA